MTRNLIQNFKDRLFEIEQALTMQQDKIQKKGFPMLDYQKKSKEFNADGSAVKFEARQTLVNCVHKVLKIRAHHKAKGFKFADLLRYLQKNQFSEEQIRREQAEKIIKAVNPIIEEKLWTIFADPVDRLLVCQERQNFKIGLIMSLMRQIDRAKSGEMKKAQPKLFTD